MYCGYFNKMYKKKIKIEEKRKGKENLTSANNKANKKQMEKGKKLIIG